jgi:hypothetical protein
VPEFLLEQYIPRAAADSVQAGTESARAAAGELTRAGTPVRLLRAIFVPEDETCFYVFEAATADAVREAARRATLPADRVAIAILV